MCDRYVLNPTSDFYQRFNTLNHLPSFPKNTDVLPGCIEPIIIRQEGLTLAWIMKWGLIPFWAKERGVGSKMYNVSAESVITKLGFKKSFHSHRCLIPANAYYKYQLENGQKIPYLVNLDYRPYFSFAGIYDVWEEPVSGHEVYTYAIITTESNHVKNPIILRQSDEQLWLNEKTPIFKLESLLR